MFTTGPELPQSTQWGDWTSFTSVSSDFDSEHRLLSPLYPLDALPLDADMHYDSWMGSQEFTCGSSSRPELPCMDDCFSFPSMIFDSVPLPVSSDKSKHRVRRIVSPFDYLNRDSSPENTFFHTINPALLTACDPSTPLLSHSDDGLSDTDCAVEARTPTVSPRSTTAGTHGVLPRSSFSSLSMSPVADLVDTPRRSTRIVMGATSPTLSHKLPTSARKTRKTTATETPRQAFESLHRCSNSRSPRHALSPVLKKLDSVKEEILSSTEVAPTSSSLASPSASKVKVEPSSPIPEPPSSPIFEEGASSPTALKRGHGEADLNYDDAEAEVDEDEDQSDEEDTYVPTRRRQAARRSRRKRGSAPRKKISGPKPVCEECDASFTRMADLTRHVSTVHQKQTDEEIRAERRPDHRRWCLGCSKILARPDARSRHEDSCVRFRQGDPECYDPESAA